jgi:hypothetical protein
MKRLGRDPDALLPLKRATFPGIAGARRRIHARLRHHAGDLGDDRGQGAILPGTLYAALARMVDDKLVEEKDGADVSGGPQRRYYRRTSFGRAVARAESERLSALLDVARAQKIVGDR